MLSLFGEDLESYIRAHTTQPDPLYDELAEETRNSTSMPQMQVGPVEGRLLGLLVAISGAQRVVEVGTFTGYSALAMAAALPETGRLITLDIDPAATAIAQRAFDRAPWGSKIELRLGPAQDSLIAMATAGERVDFAFIDADKSGYIAYYEALLPMMPAGGVIVADNTLWSGHVLNPQTDSDHAIVAFNAHVRADPRVEHVLLSVRDGMMLIRKT